MNPIEIVLAFLEGLALIASPCILPVLPLVLSTSLVGGRRRPLGIIVGFILAFSLFALASYKIVQELGIDLDIVKIGSLILLALFGLILLSSTLSQKFSQRMQGLANFGNNLSTRYQGEGFFGGIIIGTLIGIVWTPCAGPIMAAALVSIIRQQTTLGSMAIIVAFSIGTALPMLIIVLIGREMIVKMRFFAKHAVGVRRALGALVLLSVAWIGFGANLPSFTPAKNAAESIEQKGLIDPTAISYAAPDFAGIAAWINSPPLSIANLKGKVVLIDFWTYSCINCVRTLPILTAWDKKYRDKGLVIIGVHSPEFEFEKKIDNVKAAVQKYGIHYPVALDNTLSTWTNYHNIFWPAHYLINKDGQVVYTHFGEGDYDITEHNIRELLSLNENEPLTTAPELTFNFQETPETYLGSERLTNFASKEDIVKGSAANYHFPEDLPLHHWALQGKWKIEEEKSIAESSDAALRLSFNAKKVFLVMGATDKPITVKVLLNGQVVTQPGADAPHGEVIVQQHTLYELINQTSPKPGLLEIQVSEPGLEVFAFTFGD